MVALRTPEHHLTGVWFQPEWCRVTLASIGDGVITSDESGRLNFMNSVAETLTGWTLQDAIGEQVDTVFKLVDEVSRVPHNSPAFAGVKEGRIAELPADAVLLARSGSELPVAGVVNWTRVLNRPSNGQGQSAAPRDDHEGGVGSHRGGDEAEGLVMVFRDITERKFAELKVREALTYGDNIIATLREPFLVLNKDLVVVTANAAFLRTFHVSREQTEGRILYELGNRQWDIPQLRTLLDEVLPQNHAFDDYVVEHEFPAIGRRAMLLNARRVSSSDARMQLILLAIEDITAKRRAEMAIQASELRYRRLFETAKDGILILDPGSGRIVDSNPFMSGLLGYSHDEFMGKELWEIGLFRDRDANEASFRNLKKHGYVRYEHLPLQTKNGASIDVEFVSNVYAVDHRRVAQCNIRDISDRSRLEREMQEQAAELSDLHRRKDEFLAMLSHELRNPLASMIHAVELLGQHAVGEDAVQEQSRSIIERQLKQLKHLVNDLLEVSRITTGRIRLRQQSVMLRDIIDASLATVQPLIDQKKHQVAIKVPPAPIWLFADADRLEQVLVNLLTNAAKYTDSGGRIDLSAHQENGFCVLKVRDNGVGIPEELLPRIFDLFTQADRLLDRAEGGLGIGLSLVQRLVELHGGTVVAKSLTGQGSEFTVRLPIAEALAPEPAAPQAVALPSALARLRVLVVDDNIDVCESMAMLVTAAGHDVKVVHDGLSTLKLALEYRPHVVLLDIGLPGMDGHAVARLMRQQPALRRVVIVALSGYGQDSDRETSIEAGINYHLVKTAAFHDVRTILSEVSRTAA